eukprot:3440756-Pyramimonas_sp.AAC.1
MSKFEDLADAPALEGAPREASEAEPEHDDGRLSTIYEESAADFGSHVLEVRHAELREEKALLEESSLDDLFTVPTQMVPDQSVLVTVGDEQRGQLPKRG